MDYLEIEPTYKTPRVKLDPNAGLLEISGRSIIADVDSFYQPILDWIEIFKENTIQKEVKFIFDLEYFNIASSKRMLFMIYSFIESNNFKNRITVDWLYHSSDLDLLERGQDFSTMLNIPFNFIHYEKLKETSITL